MSLIAVDMLAVYYLPILSAVKTLQFASGEGLAAFLVIEGGARLHDRRQGQGY